ncbi:MAG: hypothetical protein R3E31_04950 [Chloroflexota bacterium]
MGEEFRFQESAFYEQNQGHEAEAAERYWQLFQSLLPTNLMRDRVWIELLNNIALFDAPAARAAQADWLGEFATALARLVINDQYKVAFWGWQSGQPEPHVWRTDGMLRLLHFSQRYPDNLAMSFHEFSGRLDTISPDEPGSGIGRFRHLWQICHEEDIAPPPIFITEWGWTRTRIPNPGTAVTHVIQANEELYAHFPEVRGAALWTLDREAGSIANQVADLVDPLVKMTLSRQFEITPPDLEEMAFGRSDWETDPYADYDTVSSQQGDEDPTFEKVDERSLLGNDSFDSGQTQTSYAPPDIRQQQISQVFPGGSTVVSLAAEPEVEEDRPRQVWLKAPASSEIELLVSSNTPLAEVSPDARSDDLLVWYWLEREAITHLFQIARHASQTIASQGVVQLDERLELQRPLTQTDIRHLPQLADWSLPQTETDPVQNLTTDGRWSALRGLILAWNPDLLPALARWEGEEESALWQTAVSTALHLANKEERWQIFEGLVQALDKQSDGTLLAKLRDVQDWRVRHAVRLAQGETETFKTLLDDASLALHTDQYRDVLHILQEMDGNLQSSSTDDQRVQMHTLLARAYEALDIPDRARHHWQQVAALNPANPDAFVGMERNTPDEQLAEAEKFIQGLREQQQEAAGPVAGLAAIAQRRNQFETAVSLWDKAIDLAPTPDAQQQLQDQRQVIIQYVPQAAAPAVSAPTKIVDPRQNKLYQILSSLFSRDDLRDLCVDMQIDAQDLPQDTRKNMAYALVQAVANQNRLGRLETLVKQYRPDIRHRFQDSVADLMTQSQAMLPQHPEKAISFLEDQEDEWKQGDTPELAAIHTVLARAYALTKQHDAAYLHWQRKAALQPDATDAFTGMVDAAQMHNSTQPNNGYVICRLNIPTPPARFWGWRPLPTVVVS